MGVSSQRSQRPAAPRECHRQQLLLLQGKTMNHSGGASSQSPTDGPNTWPPAALAEKTPDPGQDYGLRLALSQRAVLPPPLKDRFFRPPRSNVV